MYDIANRIYKDGRELGETLFFSVTDQFFQLLFFTGPIKISELCEHMMVSMGAASQMVDRLEKLEMVERIADPEDRRVRKVVVLDKGKKFVQDNFAFSQSWLDEISANINPEQEEQITATLSILMQSFGKND